MTGADVVDLGRYRDKRKAAREPEHCRTRSLCARWNQCVLRSLLVSPRPA